MLASDFEELKKKFCALADADRIASESYLNAPYRVQHKGVHYKGRIQQTPIVEGNPERRVGYANRLIVEVPVTFIGEIDLKDMIH